MCMIKFLRIIILSFQSHETRILSAVWEWRGIRTDCPVMEYVFLALLHISLGVTKILEKGFYMTMIFIVTTLSKSL